MTEPLMQQTGPDLALAAPPASASLEEVLRYQESLWERGEGLRVEDLVADRPQLRATPDALLELVYNEVILREEAGESPQLAEYQQRFPDLAEALRLQFEVDELLASRRSARQVRLSGGAAGGNDQPADGKRIGRYEIQGVLGKGGMGIAYRAWDPQLKRVVALKVLRAGEDADVTEIARFRAEAEAIARVRHPNILQVFDVGEHLGQPFFAMEFCPGGSLAERLNGSPLPATEAARVVEQIARGVAAAHQQKIVHRDLKPGNVLRTEEATNREPGVGERETTGAAKTRTDSGSSSGTSVATAQFKVTDFGLAKKLDDEGGQTRTGAVMGTPAYMSPEQAFGDSARVGPTADVYALGAILYECLTGRPPFKGATIPDTLDLVRHREPVPVRQLQPRTPLDLETITLKCLQKDPSKRYATAQEVADDLGRFLDGRPIVARPIGPLARAWRWAKRNRVVATLLSLTFGILLAGIASTSLALYQSRKNFEESEKNLAEADKTLREEFQAIDDAFVLTSQERLLRQPGMSELRRDLLKAALPYYENFVAKRRHDPRWRVELARAIGRLASIHYELGAYSQAMAFFRESQSLMQELQATESDNRALADRMASCSLNMAICFQAMNQLDEAQRSFLQALSMYQDLGADGDTARLEILSHLAELERQRGARTRALERADEAVKLGTALRKRLPGDSHVALGLGRAWHVRGSVYNNMGRGEDALRDLDAAGQLYETELVKRTRLDSYCRRLLAQVRGTQGLILEDAHRFNDAIAQMKTAHQEFKALVLMNPTNPSSARDCVSNLYNLGSLYMKLGLTKEAENAHQESLRERERLHREYPQNEQYAVELSDSYTLGRRLVDRVTKPEETIPWNDKIIAVLRPFAERQPRSQAADRLARAAAGKAQTLTQINRHAESLPNWDLSLQYGGAPNPSLIRTYRATARAIVGDWRGAEPDVQVVLAGKGVEKDADFLFAVGCARAAMAEAVAKDESLRAEERQTRSVAWEKAALELLRSARDLGHQNLPFNLRQWNQERALRLLRGREEFQKLLPKQ